MPPHAALELGLSYVKTGQMDKAKSWLEKARTDYSGFLIESLVHLRVHGALQAIRLAENKIQSPLKEKKGLFKRLSTLKSLSHSRSISNDSNDSYDTDSAF